MSLVAITVYVLLGCIFISAASGFALFIFSFYMWMVHTGRFGIARLFVRRALTILFRNGYYFAM